MFRIASSILLLSLAACGFQPVYGTGDGNVSAKLASVRVEKINDGEYQIDREAQILQNRLEDLFHPLQANSTNPQYSLRIKLKENRHETGITKDLRVTRYDVVPNVDYELVSLDNNKIVDSGHVTIKSSYNRAVSEFATYAAQQNAAKLAEQEIAEEIRSRLIYYFSK